MPPGSRVVGRRAALSAGALSAAALALPGLTGCTSHAAGTPSPPASSSPDADLAVVAQALAATDSVLARYRATAAAVPSLAARIAPFAARHEAHRAALFVPTPTPTGPATSVAPSSTSASSASPSSTTVAATPVVTVPPTPGAALAALRAAERSLAGVRVTQAAVASPALARLLASMGGCSAAHATLLGDLA